MLIYRHLFDFFTILSFSQVVTWFWDIVRSFEHEQKAKLLQFVTGTSGVPVQGFEFLQVKYLVSCELLIKELIPMMTICNGKTILKVNLKKEIVKATFLIYFSLSFSSSGQ